MTERTVDTILAVMQERVASKEPTPAWMWLEAAQSIQALLEAETDLLFEMEQALARRKADYLEEGMSVAKSEIIIAATDEYRNMQKQRAKIARAEEIGRIAKYQARMKDSQYGS